MMGSIDSIRVLPKIGARALIFVPCLVFALCVMVVRPLAAQTLDFEFRPPAIKPEVVCVPGPADSEIIAFWGAWDQRKLPDEPIKDIRRDIVRLSALDGPYWFDTIARVIELLDGNTDYLTDEDILILRILSLDRAGRFNELVDGDYLQTLYNKIGTLRPASRRVLSGYLRNGIGLPADEKTADLLLISAGYDGDFAALMELADRQLKGTAPEAWDIPLDITVTTAFSIALGKFDGTICERAKDIAIAYQSGRVVTPNAQISHDWYNFAAELGDIHSAWRVVRLQTVADEIEKDNQLLVRYLEATAAAQLPHAKIELARTLERGALMGRDLDRAEQLLLEVALTGDIRGLVQHASFLRRRVESRPDKQPDLAEAARRLAAHPDAPGWAFRVVADDLIANEGFWQSQDEVMDLLNRGIMTGDMESLRRWANASLAFRPDEADIDVAIDALEKVSLQSGGPQPLKDIVTALACRAPDSVDRQQAEFWLNRFYALAGPPSTIESESILDLDPDANPVRWAQIQSEALNDRPIGLAEWKRIVRSKGDLPDAVRAYWLVRRDLSDEHYVAQVKIDLSLAETDLEKAVVIADLQQRYFASGPGFVAFLDAWLIGEAFSPDDINAFSSEKKAAVLELLNRSAALGYGRAMMALAELKPQKSEKRALFEKFESVIMARGDFAAQVFAALYSDRPEFFHDRAAGIMPCEFPSVSEMVTLARDLGEPEDQTRWLTSARVMASGHASRLRQMARLMLSVEGMSAAPQALRLFETSRELGDLSVDKDIFALLIEKDSSVYDPERAAILMSRASFENDQEMLAMHLSDLGNADTETRQFFTGKIDLISLYRTSASNGDAKSMRILGRLLRTNATTPNMLTESSMWLLRAAEAGDVAAMRDFGESQAFGIGMPKDVESGLMWLKRASELGSPRAAEIVRLLELTEGL